MIVRRLMTTEKIEVWFKPDFEEIALSMECTGYSSEVEEDEVR